MRVRLAALAVSMRDAADDYREDQLNGNIPDAQDVGDTLEHYARCLDVLAAQELTAEQGEGNSCFHVPPATIELAPSAERSLPNIGNMTKRLGGHLGC